MGKETTADNAAMQKANKAALNCYPMAKLETAINELAASKAQGNEAREGGESASLHIVRIAQDYASEAALIPDDITTVLSDWRAGQNVLALKLGAEGSKFAEVKEGKDGAPTTAKLTGTGNNVMSIAKGVVDFALDVDDCGSEEEAASYRTVRTVVESLRKERHDNANPEEALFELAKAEARAAFKALADCVFGQNDIALVESLTQSLTTALEVELEAIESAEATTREAAAAKSAADRETAQAVATEEHDEKVALAA